MDTKDRIYPGKHQNVPTQLAVLFKGHFMPGNKPIASKRYPLNHPIEDYRDEDPNKPVTDYTREILKQTPHKCD